MNDKLKSVTDRTFELSELSDLYLWVFPIFLRKIGHVNQLLQNKIHNLSWQYIILIQFIDNEKLLFLPHNNYRVIELYTQQPNTATPYQLNSQPDTQPTTESDEFQKSQNLRNSMTLDVRSNIQNFGDHNLQK